MGADTLGTLIKRRFPTFLRRFAAGAGAALLVTTVVREYFVAWECMPGETMRPTIARNERLVINKLAYGITLPIRNAETGKTVVFAKPAVGDIVLLADPSKPYPPFFIRLLAAPVYLLTFGAVNLAPKPYLIRRIVALPRQTMVIRFKKVYIDGTLLDESKRVRIADTRIIDETVSKRDNAGPYVVPYNCYFVLGDNRDYNYDSRDFGAVPFSRIEGKIVGK
jgi:signal peptidase I